MCRDIRIDHLNFNRSTDLLSQCIATPIVDPVRNVVYFAWSARQTGGGAGFHNTAIYFREFDPATETFVGPVRDVDLGPFLQGSVDAVGLVRHPVTGELAIFYGDNTDCYFRTSTDNGATWSAVGYVTGGAANFYQYNSVGVDPAGAIYCWVQRITGGAGTQDTYLWKRPAAGGPFASLGLFDDGNAGPTEGISVQERASAARNSAFKGDAVTSLAVFSRVQPNNDVLLECYYTTNDWTTINRKTIKLFPNSGGAVSMTAVNPIVIRGNHNPNRVFVMWVETPIGSPTVTPYLAYTDDWGANWTIVGSPPVMAAEGWDEAFDRGFALDGSDRLYMSVFTMSSSPSTDNNHVAFRNPLASTTGWTRLPCNVGLIYESSASIGDSFTWGTKFFRSFNKQDVGNDRIEYNLLIDDIVPPPPPPPYCTVFPIAGLLAPGGGFQLCGPPSTDPVNDPWTYSWTGPGGFIATTQCITASTPGTYNLTVTNSVGVGVSCQGIIVSVPNPPPTTATGESIPFRRGDLRLTDAVHPAGNPAIRTP